MTSSTFGKEIKREGGLNGTGLRAQVEEQMKMFDNRFDVPRQMVQNICSHSGARTFSQDASVQHQFDAVGGAPAQHRDPPCDIHAEEEETKRAQCDVQGRTCG